ncbi:beta-1,4 N-acetylgalactosaminyltransferase 1-like isoform X2 [Engraulis encrasicolus]|uniref:beta-1,4 N-acetylgalactosaminyltransferase 1-like isoform X2 n=1 Tax=Engraulis encrasicolus TaxID=184585 RepID=UPI002FCE8628
MATELHTTGGAALKMGGILTERWRNTCLLLVGAGALILYILFHPKNFTDTALNPLPISVDHDEMVAEDRESGVEADWIKRTRILERHLPPPSCSCRGRQADTISSVEADKQTSTMKRRAEEHAKQQLRDSTGFAGVLISPPNSPLQYPSHGVTVEPLKTTLLPGLAVHAQGRTAFKVSLNASHGVMAVQGVPQDVRGQNQSVLDISATSLAHLNELLAQVTYCSTAYHLHMEDWVHFSFEDHEVIFPVTVKRSSVPVLYEADEDINSQVTIVTKTFLRYQELGLLIDSIRVKYPDIQIIIADDSIEPEKVEGHNIYQYIMPPLQLGGTAGSVRFYFTLDHQEGADGEGGCLSRQKNQHHSPLPGFKDCVLADVVVNFFLARTDAVRRVGFDPKLQRAAHPEFFTDGLGHLLVASCGHPELVVGHPNRERTAEYIKFRNQNNDDTSARLRLYYFKNHLKCVGY